MQINSMFQTDIKADQARVTGFDVSLKLILMPANSVSE